jgi:hypothetical protein
MTEQEWFGSATPDPLIKFVGGRASYRKLRLFAVACCQQVRELVPLEFGPEDIETVERYCDGLASDRDLREVYAWNRHLMISNAASPQAAEAAFFAASCALSLHTRSKTPEDDNGGTGAANSEAFVQIHLLRDIFGNPFRPVALDPSWLTPNVSALAQTIYTDRAFDTMPVLADALEEAGCTSEDILAHCRGDGPHVRGCWVVDLLLGKE